MITIITLEGYLTHFFFLEKEHLMLIIEKKNVTLQLDMDSNITKQLCEYFSTQPVLKAWVFGSYARGEQGPNSDIDILVRFDRERAKVGLLKYTAIILDLEKILNREVDLVEEGALLPWAEKTVNRDKQLIYERTIA